MPTRDRRRRRPETSAKWGALALCLLLLAAAPAGSELLLSDQESEVYYQLAIAAEWIQVEKDTEIVGDLHANDRVDLKKDTLVTGDVSAVGEVDSQGTVTGAITEGAEPVPLPALLPAAALRTLADRVFEQDTAFTDAVVDDRVFVDGAVEIHGTLEGAGTIIATRDIRLREDLSPPAESTRISLIALDDVRLDKDRAFRGVLRAGRDVFLEMGASLEGVIVADRKVHVKKESRITFLDFDQQPPEIVLLAPADGGVLSDASPQISAGLSDDFSGLRPESVELLIDGDDRTAEATFDGAVLDFTPSSPLADGLHTLEIAVSDHSDNETRASFAFTVDTVAPLLAIVEPAATVVGEASPPIVVEYSDVTSGIDLQTVVVELDDSAITATCTIEAAAAVCVPPPLADGSYSVTARVADLAGNLATASLDFEVILDATPPNLTIVFPSQPVLYRRPDLQVFLEYADGESGIDPASVEVRADGDALPCQPSADFATCDLSSIAAGAHLLTAAVSDQA